MRPSKGFSPLEIREDPAVTAWRSALDKRSKNGTMLEKAYLRTISLLRSDFLHGEPVPVPRDPRFEGVANLRCEDLPGYHRLLYTNVRVDEGVITFILAVVSHRGYDRLFRLRKR